MWNNLFNYFGITVNRARTVLAWLKAFQLSLSYTCFPKDCFLKGRKAWSAVISLAVFCSVSGNIQNIWTLPILYNPQATESKCSALIPPRTWVVAFGNPSPTTKWCNYFSPRLGKESTLPRSVLVFPWPLRKVRLCLQMLLPSHHIIVNLISRSGSLIYLMIG